MSLRALTLAIGSTSVAVTLAILPAAEAADAGAPPPVPACVQVTTATRYVPYGYSHVVVLRNGCSSEATCAVSSDVNPQPQTVQVKPGATAEVVTFVSSPSRSFAPRVSCKVR